MRTIKATQRLGFTLAEIEELLELSEHRHSTSELHRQAQAKVAEIDAGSTSSSRCARRLWRHGGRV